MAWSEAGRPSRCTPAGRRGYHYVDAVASVGDERAALSGLDHRCVDEGPSLRNAAAHLAEELERFAKDNYGVLSRAKAQANDKRPAWRNAKVIQDGSVRTWPCCCRFSWRPWATSPASGQDEAPRRPPEPFRVFVQTSGSPMAQLKARLEEAVPMVRERVQRRKWFQLAESAEEADVVLRIVKKLPTIPTRTSGAGTRAPPSSWSTWTPLPLRERPRERLSGLDQRPALLRASLRNAASHLAEELERFARDQLRRSPPTSGAGDSPVSRGLPAPLPDSVTTWLSGA